MTKQQITQLENLTTYQFLCKVNKANGDIVYEFVKYKKTNRRRDVSKTYVITFRDNKYIIERFEEDELNGYVNVRKNVNAEYLKNIKEILGE